MRGALAVIISGRSRLTGLAHQAPAAATSAEPM